MIFWKRLILVWNILLIQVWNCTPLESWNLADTEVREQMLKGDDLKGLLILDPVKQKNDWKSMIGSVNYLEKDYAEIDTHKFEGKNWKPIEEMIVGLNSCHNQIHHIFGTPDHETNNSWDKKPQWDSHVLASALDDYHGSIWEIFSILKIPCKSFASTPDGLNWFIQTTKVICKPETMLDNDYYTHPVDEEGLKYHLHLHQFYNIYTETSKTGSLEG
ncbi:hypothetical protein PGTUg99_022395 [Puccinia graminis f. sp. tritici]|uniref:Uncharacterized protein n=1 Tax=Puccinia graminis f. sp. tritici TaxID=56615 RepID=A0A5B0MID4_PUCGR|nr:hypothetical protein PGTUg99_022395 [Puccinia graminis f. sp. tritici]